METFSLQAARVVTNYCETHGFEDVIETFSL